MVTSTFAVNSIQTMVFQNVGQGARSQRLLYGRVEIIIMREVTRTFVAVKTV